MNNGSDTGMADSNRRNLCLLSDALSLSFRHGRHVCINKEAFQRFINRSKMGSVYFCLFLRFYNRRVQRIGQALEPVSPSRKLIGEGATDSQFAAFIANLWSHYNTGLIQVGSIDISSILSVQEVFISAFADFLHDDGASDWLRAECLKSFAGMGGK